MFSIIDPKYDVISLNGRNFFYPKQCLSRKKLSAELGVPPDPVVDTDSEWLIYILLQPLAGGAGR